MRRREFITLLGSAAAAWPLATHAQQSEKPRLIGVLMATTSDEPDSQAHLAALYQGLQEAGWRVGTNVHLEVRWSGGDVARLHKYAAELVALGCDVLSSLVRGRLSSPCVASAGRYRLYLLRLSIRLGTAMSRASPIPAAT